MASTQHGDLNSLARPGIAIWFSAFWAMVRKELTVIARYPVEFMASFGRVFLIVAIFVLGGKTFSIRQTGLAVPADIPGMRGVEGLAIYGFILFMFLGDTLWTVGYAIRHEQVQGTLEQLYLSPASKFASLVSRVTNTLIWTGLLCLAGGALMALMIGRLPVENPWLGLYLLIMSLAGTFGIGFAFAAITLVIKEGAQTMANMLQFSFLILCANFFPFTALPPFLFSLAHFIPMAYSVDAFRSALMGFPPGFPELASFPIEVIIVTVFGIVMPFIGYALYHLAEKRARRDGSLAEY
jgi:ABC-type polysaccharide/polyol phosphate export permease